MNTKWFSVRRSVCFEIGITFIMLGTFRKKRRFNLQIALGRWFILIGPN